MPFHIHVPKPLHGWKAFFNEICVIVLGILIALGLEAGVEWLHWQHKVEDGKERLKLEMIAIARASVDQIATTPCAMAQLHTVETNLLASKGTITPSPLYHIGSHTGPAIIALSPQSETAWLSLQQDGTINHFNPRVQYRLGMLYNQVERSRALTDEISDHMGRLRLAAYPVALDAGAKAALLQEVWSQIDRANNRTQSALRILAGMRSTGLAPTNTVIAHELDKIGAMRGTSGHSTIAFCRENNLPIADWQPQVDAAERNIMLANPDANKQD